MELFSVICDTCRRKLRVRDAAAIGQILACPNCGSMVEVKPPEGWQLAEATEVPPDTQSADTNTADTHAAEIQAVES
ncbi:MAG: hypothetical protein R3C10_27280 [Pirellulales bacterium]